MNESHREAVMRLLALIALATLLIFAATGIASSVPSLPFWGSQVAAIFAVDTSASTGEKGEITDNPPPGVAQCFGRSGGVTTVPVYYACYQRAQVSEIKTIQQTCSPGFEYYITESKGTITVEPQSLMPSAASCTLPTPPTCKTDSKPAIASLSEEECKVYYCVDDKCVLARTKEGEALFDEHTRAQAIQDLLNDALGSASDPGEIGVILDELTLSNAQRDALNKAFTDEQQKTQEQIAKNQLEIDKIEKFLPVCGSGPVCDSQEADLEQLKQQNAALDAQKERLAAAQQTLADEAVKGPPGGGTPTPTPTPSPQPRPQPTTFPPPSTGSGAEQGGLQKFLQGFMQALQGGGGQPPPGNQTPQPPGTCSPKTHCADNTLYSRNTQCVDTPIQQCPHGCDRNACAQAPQEPGRPTAEISCQPKKADPGMTLAITWGCSLGTSVGSGFSTGGARSGSATTTLAAPPLGTNVVSFGLTCSNKGLTAHASCEVQVAKPAIVLVANPKSVESGSTSQIGWVTSGMEECVVSSPQQSDFTARNADLTNVNGTAETSPVTQATTILLTCTTLGGNTREATTTVSVL